MPYIKNAKFSDVVGSSNKTVSFMTWDERIRGTLVQSLCRNKPDLAQVKDYMYPPKNEKQTGTFSSIIGLDALNPLYYPYAALKITKAGLFALLDRAGSGVGPLIAAQVDNNYWRVAAKTVISGIFIIPEALAFVTAKVGDGVGNIAAPIGNAIGKFVKFIGLDVPIAKVGNFIGNAMESVGKFLSDRFFKSPDLEVTPSEKEIEEPIFVNQLSGLMDSNDKKAGYEPVNTEEIKVSLVEKVKPSFVEEVKASRTGKMSHRALETIAEEDEEEQQSSFRP